MTTTSTALATPVPVSEQELRAWRALMRLSVQIPRAVDAGLRSHGLQLTTHGVLVSLLEAGGELRMSALATATGLSPSRISRVVQSLSEQGLVEQQPCPDDGRSSLAVLTSAGERTVREAWPDHARLMRELVLDRIPVTTLSAVIEALEAVVDGADAPH